MYFKRIAGPNKILKPPTAKIWSRSRTKRRNLGNKMWLMVSHLSFYGSPTWVNVHWLSHPKYDRLEI